MQARVQQRARVLLRSAGLTDAEVRMAHLEPIGDVEAIVQRLLADDPSARLCVLPQGPQTIPYLLGA